MKLICSYFLWYFCHIQICNDDCWVICILWSNVKSLFPRFPSWGTRTPRGTQSGLRGTRGENVRDNGKRTELPFETELQLSDGNIILCIKIAQIPLYFALQGCISF